MEHGRVGSMALPAVKGRKASSNQPFSQSPSFEIHHSAASFIIWPLHHTIIVLFHCFENSFSEFKAIDESTPKQQQNQTTMTDQQACKLVLLFETMKIARSSLVLLPAVLAPMAVVAQT